MVRDREFPKRSKANSSIELGRGNEYMPAIKVHNVPSLGRSTRIHGWKTNRVHHFLSDLETSYFYLIHWSSRVVDIREQFPLEPISETIAIADRLGVKHPTKPGSGEPIVMTTDFIITLSDGIEKARALKYRKDLNSTRTLQKLEIERIYWGNRQIDWGIVTENQIPKEMVKNLEWFYSSLKVEHIDTHLIYAVDRYLRQRFSEETSPLNIITSEADAQLGLEPGVSLTVVKHLLANKVWKTDLLRLINPSVPLPALTFSLPELAEGM